MALTLSAAVTKAFSAATVEPCVTVQIDTPDSTTYQFISSSESPLATTKGGDWIPIIDDIGNLSSAIDPIKRTGGSNLVNVSFVDEGKGGVFRNIIATKSIRNSRITIKIGDVSMDTAGDFAPYFKGAVVEAIPSEGHVILVTKDVKATIADVAVQIEVEGKHPLTVMSLLLGEAKVPSELIDTTSFNPEIYSTSISHFSVYKGAFFEDSEKTELMVRPVKDQLDELSELIQTAVVTDEDGKLRAIPYTPAASAVDHLSQNEFSDFVQEKSIEDVTNKAQILFFSQGYYDPGLTQKVIYENLDSQTTYAWPGNGSGIFDRSIQTPWVNAACELQQDFGTTSTTISLFNGSVDSFCGMRDDGKANRTPTASRPVYLMLTSTFKQEVIKVVGNTLDVAFKAKNARTGSVRTTKALWTLDANGRRYFDGGSTTGIAFDRTSKESTATTKADRTVVTDITLPVHWTTSVIGRLSGGGLPVINFKTDLGRYNLQIGDLVTLSTPLYLDESNDGLNGTQKFEIISKETVIFGDSPGVMFKAAKATQDSGFADRWTPKSWEQLVDLDKPGDTIQGPVAGDKDVLDTFVDLGGKITKLGGLTGRVEQVYGAGGKFGTVGPRGPYVPSTEFSFTANKDTYVSFDRMSGRHTFIETALGSAAPDVGYYAAPLSIATTATTTLDTTSDVRKRDGAIKGRWLNRKTVSPSAFQRWSWDNNLVKNYAFESFVDNGNEINIGPPDGFETLSGTWETDIDVVTSPSDSGTYAIRFKSGTSTGKSLVSDRFPINANKSYLVSASFRGSSPGNQLLNLGLEYFSTATSSTVLAFDTSVSQYLGHTFNTWVERGDILYPAATQPNARFARLRVGEAAGSALLYVDAVRVTEIGPSVFVSKTHGDQSITTNPTAIQFNNVQQDSHSIWDTPPGLNTRCKIPQSGFYYISASVRFLPLDANRLYELEIHKASNGSTSVTAFINLDSVYGPSTSGDNKLNGSTLVFLEQGDVIEFYLHYIGGVGARVRGPSTNDTWVSIKYVGF